MRTREEKTDFGKVWYMDDEDGKFRFAMYQYDDDPDVIYCSNVFVSPEHRGKGLGNNILSYVDYFAKNKNAKSVILRCLKSSFVHEWYTRHGYRYHSDDEEDDRYVWLIKNYNINEMDAIKAKIQSRSLNESSVDKMMEKEGIIYLFISMMSLTALKTYSKNLKGCVDINSKYNDLIHEWNSLKRMLNLSEDEIKQYRSYASKIMSSVEKSIRQSHE